MNKSVLLPIQPYWVFLIIAKAMGWDCSAEKTIEVRKNYPKSEDWNRIVKLYCSKDKKSFNRIPRKYQPLMKELLGKVVGEFECNNVECFTTDYRQNKKQTERIVLQSCVSLADLAEYENNAPCLYAWHISELKIYDRPKELYEFKTFCNSYYDGKKCDDCKYFIDGDCYEYDESDCGCNGLKPLEKPPQSWCYVEEVTV